MDNSEQYRSRIPDAESEKLLWLLLIVTFYLTKTTSSYTIALSRGTFFPKNAVLALKDIFSETTYVCVLTCQI